MLMCASHETKQKSPYRYLLAALFWGAALCLPYVSRAATPADQITLYVGVGPGGGVDAIPRIVSRILPRYLPEGRSVVVSNMPGAGGVVMANYLERVAPGDGKSWGFAPRAFVLSPYLNAGTVQYEPAKLKWIGNPSKSPSVGLVWVTKNSIHTIEDAKEREVLLAAASPNQTSAIFPHLLNEIVKTRFKVVTGYPSLRDMELATQSGEVDGFFGASIMGIFSRNAPKLLENGQIKLLVQFGLERSAKLPADLPLALDFAQNPEDQKLMRFLFASDEFGYPIFLSSRTSDQDAAIMRGYYAQVVADPEFHQLMSNLGIDVDPMDHTELKALAEILAKADSVTLQRARRLVE